MNEAQLGRRGRRSHLDLLNLFHPKVLDYQHKAGFSLFVSSESHDVQILRMEGAIGIGKLDQFDQVQGGRL